MMEGWETSPHLPYIHRKLLMQEGKERGKKKEGKKEKDRPLLLLFRKNKQLKHF